MADTLCKPVFTTTKDGHNELATTISSIMAHESANSLKSLDQAIENNLCQIDELSAMIESIRSTREKCETDVLPALLEGAAQLQQTYATIDAIEGMVNDAHNAVQAASARLHTLQSIETKRRPKALAKMMRSFSLSKRSAEVVEDVPEWDPSSALLDSTKYEH